MPASSARQTEASHFDFDLVFAFEDVRKVDASLASPAPKASVTLPDSKSQLAAQVEGVIDSLGREDAASVEFVAEALQAAGLAVTLRSTAPSSSPTASKNASVLRKLHNQHVVVTGNAGQEELLVDVRFSQHFELPVASAHYQDVLASLPSVFIGTRAQLLKLVIQLASLMDQEYQSKDMPLPPWRSQEALLSRWPAGNSASDLHFSSRAGLRRDSWGSDSASTAQLPSFSGPSTLSSGFSVSPASPATPTKVVFGFDVKPEVPAAPVVFGFDVKPAAAAVVEATKVQAQPAVPAAAAAAVVVAVPQAKAAPVAAAAQPVALVAAAPVAAAAGVPALVAPASVAGTPVTPAAAIAAEAAPAAVKLAEQQPTSEDDDEAPRDQRAGAKATQAAAALKELLVQAAAVLPPPAGRQPRFAIFNLKKVQLGRGAGGGRASVTDGGGHGSGAKVPGPDLPSWLKEASFARGRFAVAI